MRSQFKLDLVKKKNLNHPRRIYHMQSSTIYRVIVFYDTATTVLCIYTHGRAALIAPNVFP
jgi:hypothetical protein